MLTDRATTEAAIQAGVVNHTTLTLSSIMADSEVAAAITAAKASGVTIFTIIATIFPYVITALTGGTIDWSALIAAIMALIPSATKTKA